MVVHRDLARTLSYQQKVVLVLSKSVSATLSLIASSIIIYKLYLRFKKRPKTTGVTSNSRSSRNDSITTYHRMILGISILDVIHSTSSAFSTLLVPPSTGAVFAHGTVGTCAVQGLFQQLTATIVIYMATLNTYFMLKIRYNVSDSIIQKRYELWFHAIPIAFFLITGVTGLSLKVFNAIVLPELGCWLGGYPRGCIFTNTCTRGFKIAEYIDWYAWGFGYIWFFLCFAIVLVNSVLIYSAIRKQERRNESYLGARLQNDGASSAVMRKSSNVSNSLPEFDFSDGNSPASGSIDLLATSSPAETRIDDEKQESAPTGQSDTVGGTKNTVINLESKSEVINGRTDNPTAPPSTSGGRERAANTNSIRKSRIAAVQSSLYVSSAFFTAMWIFMPWVGNKLQVQTHWRFFFAFMVNIVSPSQGLFNLFVFVRLQYLRLRDTNKDWSRLKCVWHCLFSSDSN
jgi:hypothetical protein